MRADRPPERPLADPAAVALDHDRFGRLVLTLPGGGPGVAVIPVRCFPYSAPSEWIALCDERGHEIHCVERLDALPSATRERIEADLVRYEFIPILRRILAISPGAEPTLWEVETDRGPARFSLASEDHVRRLGPHGALITDADGVRFRILDERRLDSQSRKLLIRYL